MTSPVAVSFRHVDIVFGDQPQTVLPLLNAGASRSRILEETDHVLGVADACLDVREGDICVVMGLSGSGKSTLIRAVNGLSGVVRGEVLVRDGEDMIDVTTCDVATLRRVRMYCVAMVFQQFALFPWLTVEENAGFGLELARMDAKERSRRVDEQLALVDLEQWSGKYVHELSGGMQQRVGLARAFATDAPILLMDEPFSALDPLIRARLQDELLELQKALRKTIIFVSHDLDEALKIGNHIVILEEGRIVQHGMPQDIVLNPVDSYVTQFVSHTNPLNVLDGASLMTGLDTLPREDGRVMLDHNCQLTISLDTDGVARKPMLDGKAIEFASLDQALANPDAMRHKLVNAPVVTTIRDIIEARLVTRLPVLLNDADLAVGIVHDKEIYGGLLPGRLTGNS
ncbi:MAG: choline ABC transporter ATP-binding protein [Hyphomicrobiales bacterium]